MSWGVFFNGIMSFFFLIVGFIVLYDVYDLEFDSLFLISLKEIGGALPKYVKSTCQIGLATVYVYIYYLYAPVRMTRQMTWCEMYPRPKT